MVWMYIDHRMKKCILHSDPHCTVVRNIEEPGQNIFSTRKLNKWIKFDSALEAREVHLARYDNYQFREHCAAISEVHIIPKEQQPIIDSGIDIPSFNSVSEYYRKIIGVPTKLYLNKIHSLPLWLKLFFYLVIVPFVVFQFLSFIAVVFH